MEINKSLSFESLRNGNALLRCDFNEPIKGEILLSTKRIDANLDTVHELLIRKNKVVLMSHHSDKGQTLLPVYNYLKKILMQSFPRINFVYIDSVDEKVVSEYFIQNKNNLPEVILLENTRLFFSENGGSEAAAKNLDEANNANFGKFLSTLGDCFVYDAFSVAHRDHASTTGVAKILPTCFGKTFEREHANLKKIIDKSEETLIIMGGAKLSTKLNLVEKFLGKESVVYLGGAMTHDILKHRGVDIKNSYLEEGFTLSDEILNKLNTQIESGKLILPKDIVWNINDKDYPNTKIVDSVFDIEKLKELVFKKNIKNILWNGPVGMYENGEVAGSKSIYNFIKDINLNKNIKINSESINGLENKSMSKIFTVIGGGDTLTFLENENPDFDQDFSYVSLSGGAMLTFLSDGTLPILEVVANR